MNTPKHRLTALCVAVALAMGAYAQDPVVYGAEQYTAQAVTAMRNSDSTASWRRIE